MNFNESGSQKDLPYIQLIIIWKKWKKFILWVTLSAIFASILFSSPWFVPPIYKSEVILYPPSTNSNKILIEKDPRFGADNDVEQQIQILKSGMVRDSLIRKYHLLQHYKVDTSSELKIYRLYKEYEDNVVVDRTRYNSISVTVFDTDPLLAATMANDIVRISDHVKSQILRQNLTQAFKSLESQYEDAVHDVDALADSVNRALNSHFSSGSSLTDQPEMQRLKEQIELQDAMALARRTNKNYLLSLLYEYQKRLNQIQDLRNSYQQAAGFINLSVPPSYIISPAIVNYKKDFPNRTLIILLSAMCAFLFSLAIAVVVERVRSSGILNI